FSSTATPHPGGFKCFTCEDVEDNYECNHWAPDVYCPKDSRYCYTFHMMDTQWNSVSVTKRCAALADCQISGCADVSDNGYHGCSSYCEGNICNLLVQRNESNAIFSTSPPLVNLSRKLLPAMMTCIISSVITVNHTAKTSICGT
ncbi:ly6/PLAUR domain-containing protein 6-like, partial [Thalassophryne amazonica]|uniref:ly6/PLAUR domain-containing protein 6-like n=1 Tax=Thalassophryne amazonica TaxID=390379 RepID=UPI001471FAB2